jgi:hypothetical protein
MPAGKKQDRSSDKDTNKNLKSETARELGLEDDLANPGDELTVREAGKIGGNMVRKLVQAGKEALEETRSQPEQTDR